MKMTSMERTVAALNHEEPDRVPLFLLLTMHGAKELGIPLKTYYSDARYVIEGQKRLHRKYGGDCLYSFLYAAIEPESWGADVIFIDDGPPNCGPPIIKCPEDIDTVEPPDIADSVALQRILSITEGLVKYSNGEVPVIGVVLSPFSAPVMQMGFEAYLDTIFEDPTLFWKLMEKNKKFCITWAKAQKEKGADAITYFDPLSSVTCIPPDISRETGFKIARDVIKEIDGPVAVHLASGLGLPIAEDIISTGAAAVGVSTFEDLAEYKKICKGRLTLIGNLNGIEMVHWDANKVEAEVKEAIFKAGEGGGFILSDNHGEIPWQVPDDVLLSIKHSTEKWGRYPLRMEIL